MSIAVEEPVASEERRSPIRRVLYGLVLVVVALLVIAGLGSVFGFWRVEVMDTSDMEPTFDRGDAVLALPGPVEDLEPGDVLVFYAPETGDKTIHRVATVGTTDTGQPVITSRGDASDTLDPWSAVVVSDTVWTVHANLPVLGYGALLVNVFWPLLLALLVAVPLTRTAYRHTRRSSEDSEAVSS